MQTQTTIKLTDISRNTRPFIISGPCSAETREQVLETAHRLAETGMVHMIRAGIWKPRTKPGTFEGVGAVALAWLAEAKKLTGLPVIVEVSSPKQLDEALKYGVDAIWIGARTTANPFSVQELADALKGMEIPVFIKNPVNPDIELWSGALERIAMTGVSQVGLIHRGFSSYANREYRNAPMWQLAVDMRLRYPELMMLNDPSHICGRRDTLLDISQKAIDLDFDGLMIESHIDPDRAWSDALQQVTPAHLKELLESIIWRKEDPSSPNVHRALEGLRHEINELDDEIMELLSRRMQIAERIGAYKKSNNITILQPARWNSILERALVRGQRKGLSAEFIARYFDAVHMESINHQKKVMDS